MLDRILDIPLLPIILVFALMMAGFWLFDLFVWKPKLRREAEAAPRITMQEVTEIWDEIEAATLPAARAIMDDAQTPRPDGSRIGGAALVLSGDGEWPTSKADGRSMFLLCQINFADLPQIEDFPTSGILQIFSSFDSFGESHSEYEHVIRWDPAPDSNKVIAPPADLLENTARNRAFSETVRKLGLPLRFERHDAPGNPFNFPFSDKTGIIYDNRLPEDDAVKAVLDGWEEREEAIVEGYGTNWVGGHPHFVQEDVRFDENRRHLDRVLFHLGCIDKHVNLGDSGELNVLISREALLARDFGKAFLTWDCS